MDTADLVKYQQAVLYFLHECNNGTLGKTKLMKLLYYLDFDHFQQCHASVTGDVYIKKPYGPVPAGAEVLLSSMVQEGLIARMHVPVYDYLQERHEPLVPYDLSVFSDSERKVLVAVADRWRFTPLEQIIDATHSESPWNSVDLFDEIPYESAHSRGMQQTVSLPLQRSLSPTERDYLLRSVISSEALEGVLISREEAERLLDEALAAPLPSIG